MATTIIGSARHDENKKYINGKPGDQLQSGNKDDYKGEVSMQYLKDFIRMHMNTRDFSHEMKCVK